MIIKMKHRPLETLPIDHEATIRDFDPALSEEFKLRLRELGFREGAQVKCIRKTPLGGPRIFLIGGAVFSIDSLLAKSILLEASL
jgi:Fe2+ transport system protein FeoA